MGFSIARTLLVLILPQLLSCQSDISLAADSIQQEWNWKDSAGVVHQESELKEILRAHAQWIESKGSQGKCADFTGADLTAMTLIDADLADAKFTRAILARAKLVRTNFARANMALADFRESIIDNSLFHGANLTGSRFDKATLTHARFDNATMTRVNMSFINLAAQDLSHWNLSEANLLGANLKNATLERTNLNNALLTGVSLSGALLQETYLHNADIEGADFSGAVFEINKNSFPKTGVLAKAKHLELLTYLDDSEPLSHLRESFKDGGFRDQERQITFALKKRQAQILWDESKFFEYWMNRILFDLPSQYGMNPGRALIIILVIFATCTALYWTLIHFPMPSGLSIVVPAQHNNQPLWLIANLSDNPETIEIGGFVSMRAFKVQSRYLSSNGSSYFRELVHRELALLWVSLIFSLMSTFNIKFKDVDFGRWLRLLMTKEYDIKATGAARTVSGVQALLSVYLITLLIVTYFARPFE